MSNKQQLIIDIQNLLNSHENISATTINPSLLECMDEKTLKDIIGSLLDQKESSAEVDTQWLKQFKQDNIK
jgi:hypothetical protein